MLQATSGNEHTFGRLCLCCEMQSATRSIPACWDHWNVLPEDLRSSIVMSYGRGHAKAYGENLMQAVHLWRLSGVWRLRSKKTRLAIESKDCKTSPEPSTERRVISLLERRQKFASPTTSDFHSAAGFAARAVCSGS
jgi:hypothetical protein